MIKITGRHLKLGEGFILFMKNTFEKKVKKFATKKCSPDIIIHKSGTSFRAEISYYYKKQMLLATSTAENAKKAFSIAIEKLHRQLEKAHERSCDYA